MILAVGVSTGVGISRAKLYYKKRDNISLHNTAGVENELHRLDLCIKAANDEIKSLSADLNNTMQDTTNALLDKYLRVINNYGLIEDIKNMIRKDNASAEYAIKNLLDNAKKIVEGLDDEYLVEKAGDIEEIKLRLLNNLDGSPAGGFADIRKECILVADDLTPSDVLSMSPSHVKGIVTILGGPTSSSSIMARYLNIPAVMGVGEEGYVIRDGDLLIVDGNRGRVVINPDDSELHKYMEYAGSM